MKGFWSLTMYDEQMFFVANPINRYSMSVRTNPKYEPDGSLVIYIQNASPGADKEANWLPAPKGKFHLMLRLYWPDEDRALDHRRVLGHSAGREGGLTARVPSPPGVRPAAPCFELPPRKPTTLRD